MHEPRIGGPRMEEPPVDDLRIGDLRIGDAERDEAMAALREHYAQGRITSEELDERLEKALTARTARDLRAIAADLPDLPGPRAHPGRSGPWRDPAWHRARWDPAARPRTPWGPSPGGSVHAGSMSRSAPWGPPSRRPFGPSGHPRGGRPPFPLVLLAALVIVSVVTGTAWPLLFAVKALVFGLVALAVIGMFRGRHRRGIRG